MSTLLVLGPMVAMIEDWVLALCEVRNVHVTYLSEVLLLRSEVVETSSKLSVPSELGEGNSRWGELCHFVSAGKNLVGVWVDGRGRSGCGWSEDGSGICGYR